MLREFVALTREAARLWWRFLPAVGFWVLVGHTANLLAGQLSTLLGADQRVWATLVFVAGVIAWIGCLVLAVHAFEPGLAELGRPLLPGTLIRGQTRLQVLTAATGPVLAVYAAWGLVEEQVSELLQANLAVHGIDAQLFSIDLGKWDFYLWLALGAWVSRLALRRWSAWRPSTAATLVGLLAEGTFVFALFIVLRTAWRVWFDWLTTRQVWHWFAAGWDGFVAVLPPWRIWFDLTVPEVVRQLGRSLWTWLAPGFGNAVLLPLMWIALVATVFGWREFRARDLVAGTAAAHMPDALAARVRVDGRRHPLLAAADWLTRDLREKYLPVLTALRLVGAAGARFTGAFLVLVALDHLVWNRFDEALTMALGPRPFAATLGTIPLQNLIVAFFTTTTTLAIFAAGFDRALAAAAAHPLGLEFHDLRRAGEPQVEPGCDRRRRRHQPVLGDRLRGPHWQGRPRSGAAVAFGVVVAGGRGDVVGVRPTVAPRLQVADARADERVGDRGGHGHLERQPHPDRAGGGHQRIPLGHGHRGHRGRGPRRDPEAARLGGRARGRGRPDRPLQRDVPRPAHPGGDAQRDHRRQDERRPPHPQPHGVTSVVAGRSRATSVTARPAGTTSGTAAERGRPPVRRSGR